MMRSNPYARLTEERWMKKLTTKIGKQFGGYALIRTDLEFSGFTFARAADLSASAPPSSGEHDLFPTIEQDLEAAHPLLRSGGAVMFEGRKATPPDFDKRAYFEAGIVAYAKCFNSNLRTRLSQDIFKGALAGQKELHLWCMEVRNSHIAHADLRLERSYTGINLVTDAVYGVRPSGILMTMQVRRNVPSAETLLELSGHCALIVEHYLAPQMEKTAKEIREQMLRLPKAQFDALPDYAFDDPATEFPDDPRWLQDK
jgi:hypothetical protein